MKFARYLKDTQTPEWKRAYIDYRGLKKRIGVIRRAQDGGGAGIESPTDSQEAITSPRHGSEPPESPVSTTHREFPGPSTRTVDGNPKSTDAEKINRMPSQGGFSLRSRRTGHRTGRSWTFSTGLNQPRHPFGEPLPLNELIPLLSPQEQDFFLALDSELEKIESFYLDREKEMASRTQALEEQMNELSMHGRRFRDLYGSKPQTWLTKLKLPAPVAKLVSEKPSLKGEDPLEQIEGEKRSDQGPMRSAFDQEEYQHAKKRLKKAVIENYRGLEALNNYRILNITGIRKALKKFEKFTKISCLQTYMSEKVDSSAVSSGDAVETMMKKMEDVFAGQYMRGDMRRAKARLRAGTLHKSHHFSTFRSGLCLGLAAPAFAVGLYQSFLPATRTAIKGWDALLYAYGIFMVPALFAVLVGINLVVWARCRINYVFIFELSTRTRLDYREYFEIPSIILATLCYAFWLSFSRIGSPHLAPQTWLLVWLAFAAVLLLNPLPVTFKQARQWLLKKTGRLLISGTRRVEFADFWLGDQFCSLIWTLSNLSFVVCSYADGFNETFQKCGNSSRIWPAAFVLATLPLLARTAQSIKRYSDSGLITHLINGGKYASGILAYVFYYLWRHQGGYGGIFITWCLCNTWYSAYAVGWDLLMDWSVLNSHAEHVLLRPSLLYGNWVPLYYFAMLSNAIIRFIWVIYIPKSGISINLRTFIAAMLEMFRRWQWNFYRLENEHLGNMDQYRITREVPLPYTLDSVHDDADEEEL